MPVSAGQFSLHHTHLVHNSRPNPTDDRRIGLGLSYIPTHVRCTSGDAERAAHADAVAQFRASDAEQTRRYQPSP